MSNYEQTELNIRPKIIQLTTINGIYTPRASFNAGT